MAIAAGAGVAYLYLNHPAVPPPENVTARATPEMARGEYLATHVTGCVVCHADDDEEQYAAPVVPGTEGRGGDNFGQSGTVVSVLVSQNLTPAGIGAWSDGEFIRACTTGVSRSGTPLFPIMRYRRNGDLSRDDVHGRQPEKKCGVRSAECGVRSAECGARSGLSDGPATKG
jgi:hypothetical protein